MTLLLASCTALPEPDPDAAPLSAALTAAGIDHRVQGWNDPAADWSTGPVVLRSTWDYPWCLDDFLQWVDFVGDRLMNPAPVVRWNAHKRYLLDLQVAGVPTTPTVVVPTGDTTPLAAICAERGWDEVVVKPAVSAGSYRTLRTRASAPEGQAHLADLAAERDVLVQPYLTSVEGHGERALVWIDGALSHSVRKTPRWQGMDEAVSTEAMPISDDEAALAARALAAIPVPGDLLYARIDVAPGPDGSPVLMELELIEPSLFFRQGEGSVQRYVQALQRRL
jgi:hypothetical protein